MSFSKTLTKKILNYNNEKSEVSRLRVKRISRLLKMIKEVHKKDGLVNIVDIGGTKEYWNIVPSEFLENYNVNITIINVPGTGKYEDNGPFKFVEADGCDLKGFKDNSFHISHSNSVIEHVGGWQRKVDFAKEVSRVSQSYYIQTPNYWFPIEPHCMTPFYHWLPKPIQVWLVMHFELGNWSKILNIGEAVRHVESFNLVNKVMLQELFGDGKIIKEKFFMFTKSITSIKHK